MADVKPLRKKAVNGRAKGAGFELTIAKLLTETFAPMQFRRSQSSGAILGGKNEADLHKFSEDSKTLFIGDVVPSNEADVARQHGYKLRFCIECKFYQAADTFQGLFKSPQVLAWFAQASTDAAKVKDKSPLLIFKFNFTDTYVGFNVDPPPTATRIIKVGDLSICTLAEALKAPTWWQRPVSDARHTWQRSTYTTCS
jgi:hypothetical protein